MLEMQLSWNRPAKLASIASSHYLRIRLQSGSEVENPPLHVAIALDTSGSMDEAGKLESAKQACMALVGLMRAQDRISLASYATSVKEKLRALAGGQEALPTITPLINGLKAEGVTRADLALAWILQVLAGGPASAKLGVLITDGQPTDSHGDLLNDHSELLKLAAGFGQQEIVLSTVGLGRAEHFNAALLSDLSDRGRGAFVYAATAGELSEALRKRLAVAQQTATGTIRISINSLVPGLVIGSSCRIQPEFVSLDCRQEGGKFIMNAGALRNDTATDLLLKVDLPSTGFGQQQGIRPVLEVTATGGGNDGSARATASIAYTASYTESQRIDVEVEKQRHLWDANVCMDQLKKTDDVHRTVQLLASYEQSASAAGATGLANQASQQLDALRKTGVIDVSRRTRLLDDTRQQGQDNE